MDVIGKPTLLLLALATALPAQADVIRLKRGKPVIGAVREQGGDTVVYNVYRTAIPRVTHGTEQAPARSIKKITPDPDAHRAFWRRAGDLRGGTADAWCALGQEAAKGRLKGLARYAFTEALVREPQHEAARKGLGSKAKKIIAADPRLNAELAAKLAEYLVLEDAGARLTLADELEKLGCAWPTEYLERGRRSNAERRGRTDDRRLTLRSDRHPGAVYTLLVPRDYDPLRPTPLVVGLHGGGRGGKAGELVVGSGTSAMNFFERAADQRGWIAVCPTALKAPWANPANDAFLLAVVEEICCLFNVDENRIYLAGHSMGGFGTWHYGPKYAHLWAAVSPNAGGGGRDLARLEDTLTGIYCYHGADDAVVGVSSDRRIAEQMLGRQMDFVYCEIPDSGHGWPGDVREEMWRYFDLRRLAVAPRRGARGKFRVSEEPLSSFLRKPARDEIAAWGPVVPKASRVGASAGASAKQVKALLADLRAGGGRAEKAAETFASVQDAGAAKKVARLLGDDSLGPDARRFAALALGGMGQKSAAKALRRAMLDEALPVCGAAALALGRLGDEEAPAAFDKAVATLAGRFDAKKTGARMHYSDYEVYLAAAAEFAQGIGATGDRACVPALAALLERFLLVEVDVPTSRRAGQDAGRPRRHCAGAVLDACDALRGDAVRAIVEALSESSDLGVTDRARKLLGQLSGR